MLHWIERFVRRDITLVLGGVCFILLLAGLLHVFEPRKIVKWDDVVAGAVRQ